MASSQNGRKISVEAWRICGAGPDLARGRSPSAPRPSSPRRPMSSRAKTERMVLVELYTSQGCSSCPPADHLQAELAERPDVLALTFPVDYWDYLGWHDTLAHPAESHRQMDYSKRSQFGPRFHPADGHRRPVQRGWRRCAGCFRQARRARDGRIAGAAHRSA